MASTRPYLIRAIYEWALDNGYTPFVLVDTSVDGVVVPEQFVEDNSIVLNVSPTAVRDLNLGDEFISFNARFAGVSQELFVPINSVRAVYAKENGEGIALPVESGVSMIGASNPDELPSGTAESGGLTALSTPRTQDSTADEAKPSDSQAPGANGKPVKRKPPHLTIVE